MTWRHNVDRMLVIELGGDDPGALIGGVRAALARSRGNGVVPPNCTASVDTVVSEDTPIDIPDGPGGMASSTVIVSGVVAYLQDLNLLTDLPHTFAADLDITVTSPAGTEMTLTTDNGAGNEDVFAGTTWDDDAGDTNPPGPVTDNLFDDLVVETPLVPEEALAAFTGEDPNGTWTITIVDDAGEDIGTLQEWSLEMATCRCVETEVFSPVALEVDPAPARLGRQRRLRARGVRRGGTLLAQRRHVRADRVGQCIRLQRAPGAGLRDRG